MSCGGPYRSLRSAANWPVIKSQANLFQSFTSLFFHYAKTDTMFSITCALLYNS